jgi:sugar (pentulose or hexulose) kinase
MLALGIDSGTSNTKSIVFDVGSGELIARPNRPLRKTVAGRPDCVIAIF